MKHDVYIVYYSEITFIRVKLIKCNELISLLKSHSDLDYWNAPHFCSSGCWPNILYLSSLLKLSAD